VSVARIPTTRGELLSGQWYGGPHGRSDGARETIDAAAADAETRDRRGLSAAGQPAGARRGGRRPDRRNAGHADRLWDQRRAPRPAGRDHAGCCGDRLTGRGFGVFGDARCTRARRRRARIVRRCSRGQCAEEANDRLVTGRTCPLGRAHRRRPASRWTRPRRSRRPPCTRMAWCLPAGIPTQAAATPGVVGTVRGGLSTCGRALAARPPASCRLGDREAARPAERERTRPSSAKAIRRLKEGLRVLEQDAAAWKRAIDGPGRTFEPNFCALR